MSPLPRSSATRRLLALGDGHARGAALELPFLCLQTALQFEASQLDRYRMAGGSCVPSRNLVRVLNRQRQSDAIVQFFRALAAFYMLANPADFDLFWYQFDGEERSWSLSKLCLAYVCPHCEGAQAPQADEKQADVGNIIKAISQVLQVPVKVGSNIKLVPFPDPEAEGSDKAYKAVWSDCQVQIVHKPGHFSSAWA
ncbi:hypothetical protein ABBQ32_004849 [Trebouxia sp. C0010 RCD-2024]